MDASNIPDIGLSVIFDPESQPLVDIVLVHGIQGHPVRTWTEHGPSDATHELADGGTRPKKKGKLRKWARRIFGPRTMLDADHADSHRSETLPSPACFWPKDLLPVDLPRSRILTWGYDSMVTRVLHPTDKSNLFTHAKNFAFALGRMAVASRPIIFIAHSLGGIVVKEMLAHCDSSETVKHQGIAASTAAIMFFGTPHRGSKDVVGYGEVARKAASILLDTNSALLDSLGLRTTDLERSQEAFVKLWRKYEFRVKTFQEATGLSAAKIGVFHQKVVPDFSSRLDDPREEAETLPGNHMDIVRVASKSDPKFVAIIGELSSWYEGICTRSAGQPTSLQADGDNQSAPIVSPSHSSDVICRNCQLTKANCDREKPNCSRCKSQGVYCTYQSIEEPVKEPIEEPRSIIAPGASGSTTHQKHTPKVLKKAIIQSLAFDQMRHRENSINQPQQDTCDWLRDRPEFRSWLGEQQSDNSSGILWIRGKPGSGKSTLFKATAQDPCLGSCLVASYYFDGRCGNQLKDSELGLYRSLVYQLLIRDIRSFWDTAVESYGGQAYNIAFGANEREDWTVASLKSVLRNILHDSQRQHRPVVFIIDALDECEQSQARSILKHLRELVDMNVLRLCVSSRSSSRMVPPKCLVINMEDHNRGDISLYVHGTCSNTQISDDHRFNSLAHDITSKSQGVFLWVALITDQIMKRYEDGESWSSITTSLSEVPPELSSFYEGLLADIPATEEAVITYQFFVWAVLSTQRLRMKEWHYIFPFLQETHPRSFDTMAHSAPLIESDQQLERKIRRISRGLVEVKRSPDRPQFSDAASLVDMDSEKGIAGSLQSDLGETRLVQVVHDSVKQFFLRGTGFKVLLSACRKHFVARDCPDLTGLSQTYEQPLPLILAEGHYSIMGTCLAYLNISEFDDLVEARKTAMRKEMRQRETRDGRIIHESRYTSEIDTIPSFNSAGSAWETSYRSPQSSTYHKDVYHSSNGTVIVNHHARGFDCNEPRPSYSARNGAQGLGYLPSFSSMQRVSSMALAQFADQQSPNEIMRRYLGYGIDSLNSSGTLRNPSSIQASSIVYPGKMRVCPALMAYATEQLFEHARLAEVLGSEPGSMVQQVNKMWGRYWILRGNDEMPNMLEFYKDIGLESWVEAIEAQT